MQNDELRRVQQELENSRSRLAELFDFAPVAYVTLDSEGIIREANLAAASLLGVNRGQLLFKKLTGFIANESQDAFYLHQHHARTRPVEQSCELKMLRNDGSIFFAAVKTRADRTRRDRRAKRPQWLVTLTDITGQKRAELALRESERFAISTLDSLSNHIAILDESGAILAVNRAWRHFAEENPPVRKKVSEGANYLAACDAARGGEAAAARAFADGIRRVMAGRQMEFSMEYDCHSPTEQRWFVGRVTRFIGKGPLCVVVAHEDITARKLAEERIAQLSRAQAILADVNRAIVQVPDQQELLDEICRVTVERGGFKLAWIGMVAPDGMVEPVAQAGAIGYLKGIRIVTHDVPEGRGPVGRAIRENCPVVVEDIEQDPRMAPWRDQARRHGLRYAAAFPIHLEDKVIGSLQVYAPKAGFFDQSELALLTQMSRDVSYALTIRESVTARQRSELARRQSEQELSEFFENSPVGLFWVAPTGRIALVNHAGLDLLGCTEKDALGRDIREFLVTPEVLTSLLTELSREKTVQNVRARFRDKGGHIKHVLIDASGRWEKRQVIQSRWFVRNITDRVDLEREILAISEREQSRIGQDLHDDLCQQLAGIQFLSEGLAKDLAGTANAQSTAVREIAEYTRQALADSRELARGLSPVDLGADGLMHSLRQMATRTAKVFRRDCQFHCPAPVLVPDHAVSIHLYRIAQEAISNAIKHGKASRIDIGLRASGKNIVLGVKDNGRGIKTPSRARKGMGLRIMQYRTGVIGGSLIVEKRPDGGTEVVCTVANGMLPPEARKEQ